MTEYTIDFFGTDILTTVTSSSSDVTEWIEMIRYIHRFRLHKLVVGLGVQWRPTFSKGDRPPPATLQLCVGCRCLIFQLIHAYSIPQELRDFFQEFQFTFVGVGIRHDMFLLSTHGLRASNFRELRYLAADRLGIRDLHHASMERLASEVLDIDGVEKPVEIGKSDWDNSTLSKKQVRYACIDAYVSFKIGRELEAWDDDDDDEDDDDYE
ncbi:3'-5' exonuclease-like [Magnolia sinica]|uniref:3'-5' exonuclease-like n=1 Tax=Magnolia sinica TaxID=86752 RepID=UPI00265B40F1|nr:3'-5' exonuclease-like [Magnolia sinica]